MTSRERRYLPREGRESRGVGVRVSDPGMLDWRRAGRGSLYVSDASQKLGRAKTSRTSSSSCSSRECHSGQSFSKISHGVRGFLPSSLFPHHPRPMGIPLRCDSRLPAPRGVLKGHVGVRIYQSRVIAALAIRLASESAPDKEAGHP